MKLNSLGLAKALDAGLKPLYVILGEEAYAAQEAADAVRERARAQGYDERALLFVEPGFSWDDLHAEAASGGSLFGNKRLIEVKITNGRINAAGLAAITEFASDPPPDTLLLVVVLGADYRVFKSAGARKLSDAAVVVECRPLSANELVRWIKLRLKARGLDVPEAEVALIADSAQGNLLAAAQAVERLTLIGLEGAITLDTVREAAVDEARYGLFDLADAALDGDAETALRILVRLRETGTASPQVLWVLARDLRLLAGLAWAREHGATPPRIWPPARTQRVTAALHRRRVRGWQALVVEAANIDRVIKGRAPGDSWQRLEKLLFAMAGARARNAA